jgi:dienelactone hydrolase
VKAQLLVCNGTNDKFVPQEQIDAFKNEMRDVYVNFEFVNY